MRELERGGPSGWRLARISEVADVRLSNVDKKSSEGEVPVRLCNYMDVYSNSTITSEIAFMEATAPPAQIARFRIRRGDVMITKDSEDPSDIAVPSVVAEDLEPPVLCGYHLALIRPGEDVHGPYMAWALRAQHVNQQFQRQANGSTRFGLTSGVIKDATLPLPPLPEQKKIAAILSSVDDAIAATRKVIEQTERLKKGLLQTLMTRGIGHTRFKKTEIGEIPEGWEVMEVDAVCETISVGIVVRPAALYVEDGVPCIRSANITSEGIRDGDWVHISPESNRLHSKSMLRAGDVVVVRSGDPGKAAVIPPDLDGCNAIDVVFARPRKSVVSPEFLAAFMNSELGRRQTTERRGGLAQKHLNVGAMKKMRLPLPSLSEQETITEQIRGLRASCGASSKAMEGLQTLKRGLLQDLLTGRVRVTPD